MRIAYSEVFYSLEGEGPLTGVPMVFVRLFGCNFTCSGFNSNVSLSEEHRKEKSQVKTLAELDKVGILQYGCDSAYSWHPDFKHLRKFGTEEEVLDEIESRLPAWCKDSTWDVMFDARKIYLCLTGGEPMLNHRAMLSIMRGMFDRGHRIPVLVETNGSILMPQDLKELFWDITEKFGNLDKIAISPKLSNSGEPREKAIRPDVVRSYIEAVGSGNVYMKYVSDGTRENMEEIVQANKDLGTKGLKTYVMPVGATKEQTDEINQKVAELCMEYGYYFCLRVQNYIWNNATGR